MGKVGADKRRRSRSPRGKPKEEDKEKEKEKDAGKEGEDAEKKKNDGEEAKEKEKAEEAEKPTELTDEEKAVRHLPNKTSDLTKKALSEAFAKFTLPSAEEGFDEIRFVWDDGVAAKGHLKEWVLDQ